jgi:hypothetical protein
MPLYASGASFKVDWINPPEPFRRRGLTSLPKEFLGSKEGQPAFVGSLSLNISEVFKLVKCSPVVSCLGSSLPGRSRGRGIGTPCAFLTGVRNVG